MFIVMVASAILFMVLFITAVAQAWNGVWKHYEGGMIVGWITFTIVVPFLILLLILLVFHIHLIVKGKTTY